MCTMSQKRTTQDLYALLAENFTDDEDELYEAGDIVTVYHRLDRLEDFGWVLDGENDSAMLTEIGAALINYANYTRSEGRFGEAIEMKVGDFVEEAKAMFMKDWEVVEVGTETIVVENQDGDRQEYVKAAG